MTDFYIAPDFPSSYDSGMLAKKLQLKKNNSFVPEKNKIKTRKKQKKTILIWALYLLTHKCVK